MVHLHPVLDTLGGLTPTHDGNGVVGQLKEVHTMEVELGAAAVVHTRGVRHEVVNDLKANRNYDGEGTRAGIAE